MNGKRILGQVFLWAGFLSAALATVSQQEFDLLPESDRAALNKMEPKLSLPKALFATFTEKEINKLSDDELAAVVSDANAMFLEEEKKFLEEEKKKGEQKQVIDQGEGENSSTDYDSINQATKADKKERPITGKTIIEKRLSNIENKWPSISWLWYGLSMLVGIVGVVLLRSTAKSAEEDLTRVDQEYSVLTQSLDRLTSQVATLHNNLDKMPPVEIVHFIDDNLAEEFANFADSRNSLIQHYGLNAYAEIMTQFASAERFINRSWSAAADGYVDEVATCVERAQAHLKQANQLINEKESKVP